MSRLWPIEEIHRLILEDKPVLDVRAAIEFNQGHVPGATNQPILNDKEREAVGTVYKERGQDAAIDLGHQLVSGVLRENRIQGWVLWFQKNPEGVLSCFRGGLRSQLAQTWCREAGLDRPRLEGGYKAVRQFFVQQLQELPSQLQVLPISGMTGSGKSLLLRELKMDRRVVDLELLAHHRGSAFGGYGNGQPTQAQFENELCAVLFRYETQRPSRLDPLILEDESRMIGRCVQPEGLFNCLRSSAVVLVTENLEVRTQITFDDYISSTFSSLNPEEGRVVFERYEQSLQKISKKLGGLRTSEVLKDLRHARQAYELGGDLEPNKIWIQKLLQWYYDPLYQSSFQKREPKILFRGSRSEVREYLLGC